MKLLLIFSALLSSGGLLAQTTAVPDARLHIDPFGYLPGEPKIAVIASPQTGYNAPNPLTPTPVYRVKRASDNLTVYSGPITAWKNGAVHDQSGDKVWHFDFTTLTEPGEYYLFDSLNNLRSWTFSIADCAFDAPLKAAQRALFYQRCGMPKAPPFAEANWTDPLVCHRGNLQDNACRNIQNPVAASARDLHGGWHDAGDYNKYVTFTYGTLIDLLLAFEENPDAWTDDNDIPESGNGRPDLLDEVKYELDWLRRMQGADGSVLSVVGVQNFAAASPPGADAAQRFYGPPTTAATLSVAAVFALAAREFGQFPAWASYADSLEASAIAAWIWADAHPNETFYNSGVIAAGENEVDDYDRSMRKLAAASFLFVQTSQTSYRTYFDAHYQDAHLMQWGYAYPFEPATQDALLFYKKHPAATAAVKMAIQSAFTASMRENNADNLPSFLNEEDPYQAYLRTDNYTWGSNTTKSHQGNMFFAMNQYGLDASNAVPYRNAALGFVHYLHGVNPTGYCYLTNMGAYGGEASIPSVYHGWFGDATPWDDVATAPFKGPAPGLIAGGPNPNYHPDPSCNCLISPPENQPAQKSFKAWNTSWPENSWELTEPGIYTQAAYLRLLGNALLLRNNPPACESTGVDTQTPWEEASSLEILPNPATGAEIIVKCPLNSGRIEVVDVSGNVVVTQRVTGSLVKINVEAWPKGLYFVRLEGGGKRWTGKIEIAH